MNLLQIALEHNDILEQTADITRQLMKPVATRSVSLFMEVFPYVKIQMCK